MIQSHFARAGLIAFAAHLLLLCPALRAGDAPASAPAESVIANGSFEDGSASWWGGGLKKNGGGIVEDNPAEGTRALKVTSDFVCQDKRTVAGGKRYKISMKIRSDAAPEGSVYVQLSYRGPGVGPSWHGPATATISGRTERALFVTGGTQGWKEFSAVVEAPAQADQALLYLRKIDGSSGAAFFDSVKMEPTTDDVTGAVRESAPPTGSIISNGSFEDGSASWWGGGLQKNGGGIVEDNPAEGTRALKVTSDFVCQDKRAVAGGKRYKLSMKIRSDAASEGSVYVQLSFRGTGVNAGWYGPATATISGKTERALYVTGGTHGWKEFSAVVETPAQADQMLLYLRKIDGSAGAAFFDSIKMEPTTEVATTAGELRRRELAKELGLSAAPVASAAEDLQKAINLASTKPEAGNGGNLMLVNNGTSQYRVHLGTDADVRELAAGRDLAEYIGKISGADLSAISHDGRTLTGPLLIVGRENALARKLGADIAWKELGNDGFVVRAFGPHLLIAGNTPGGTMYGVNWFLDHKLGIRWLAPDYTHIPTARTLNVPATINEVQKPRFTFRQILSTEGQIKSFQARNLLNGNSHGAYGILAKPEMDHWENSWQRPGLTASFYDLMPPKTFQAQHPDWFAGGQVAMMNPQVRKTLADAIVAKLKGVGNYQDYWFGFMDNDWGWDMDPASAAFAKEHGNVPSAPRLDMALDVAKQVRAQLPGARIAFNAYHWSFTPPTNMAVPDDVLVYPMTIHVDYSTALNKGRNIQLGKDIEGWNAIAKNVLLWDHVTNFNGYIQPTPNIYPICESIRWLATLPNVRGYFAEGSWNTKGAEFSSLRVWIMARMLWDPGTDFNAAIADYCNAYYGPAAGPIMKEYIDLMHAASTDSRAEIWEKTNVDSAMLTLDFVTQADALMAKAQAAAASEPEATRVAYERHVRQTRLCVDYVILLRRKEFAHDATLAGKSFDPDTAARLARFNEAVAAEGIKQYRQGGTMQELAEIMAIERKDSAAPALVKDLPKENWREIQDLGFNRYYKNTVIVPDNSASDGATARLEGGKPPWVVQLKLHKLPEEGLWDIYADVRVEANPGATLEDTDVALAIGSAPPMGRFTEITAGTLRRNGPESTASFQLVKAPGGPFRYHQGDGHIIYIRGVSPAKGKENKVKYIYVDRFIAVRAVEKSSTAK